MRSGAWGLAGAIALGAAAGCGGEDDAERKRGAAAPQCSRGSDGAVVTRPRWKPGQRIAYDLLTKRTGTGIPAGSESKSRAVVTVRSRSKRGYRLRFDLETNEIPEALEGQAIGREFQKLSPIRIDYRAQPDGTVDDVENLEALRAKAGRVVDVLARSGGLSEQQKRRTRATLTSDAFLQTAFIEPALLLHSAYGERLRPGVPISRKEQLPSPFGGAPLPSDSTYRLNEARDRNGCARIDVTLRADPKDLRRELNDLIRQQGGRGSVGSLAIRTSFRFRYVFDRGAGVFTRVESVKSVVAGGKTRTDETVFVLRR